MKKILIIGCPGSGKSTFARKLQKLTGLPLFYLDMLWHKPDKTTVSEEEFDQRLSEILKQERWIMDGNYRRTLPLRLAHCDTVFWLDYPLEVCLQGIQDRKGKTRVDMPWVETEDDEEFMEWVRSFPVIERERIKELLAGSSRKNIIVFHSREESEKYLQAK